MDGGAIIGQGTYGCVFDPPLRCAADTHKKGTGHRRKVGKIGRTKEIEAEARVAAVLRNVPDASNMYILVDKSSVCKPAAIKKQPAKEQDDMEHCEAYKKWGMSDMLHYTMNYGGITIKKMESKPVKEFPIYSFAKHLLTCTSHLLLNGLVHFDIHTGNVLINPKTYMPVLIDFGMTFFVSDIEKAGFMDNIWTSFAAWANPEPPELTYATGIRKGMSPNSIFMSIMEEKPSVIMMDAVFKASKLSQMKQLIDFVNTSHSVQRRDWGRLFSKYWPGFDAWAVGGILIHFYKITMLSKGGTGGEFAKYGVVLKRAIKGLLSSDPRKRIDCLEALAMLDPDNELVSSAEGSNWLNKRAAARQVVDT